MERPGVARLLVLALMAAVIALSGCGDDDDIDADAPSGLPAAGGGGALAYAIPDLPPTLDPLAARNRAALTVVRQVHEPLVELLRGPYDVGSLQPGLALTVTPSSDRTTWRVTLRPGVRFQDGAPFNAAAVCAHPAGAPGGGPTPGGGPGQRV